MKSTGKKIDMLSGPLLPRMLLVRTALISQRCFFSNVSICRTFAVVAVFAWQACALPQ